MMDRELSDDLTSRMPIVPHSTAGVDCCGCIVAAVDGNNVELRCNDCGAVVGVIQVNILRDLLGLESAAATCPHCGKENMFPGFTEVSGYVCSECGKVVRAPGKDGLDLDWVEIHDDTCTWYEFDDGREPIPVMKCNRCGRHPNVDRDGVVCALCGDGSPLRRTFLEKVIEAWNEMVDPGD